VNEIILKFYSVISKSRNFRSLRHKKIKTTRYFIFLILTLTWLRMGLQPP